MIHKQRFTKHIIPTTLYTLLALIAFGTLFGYAGRSWWLFDAVGMFRPQYLGVLILLTGGLWVRKRPLLALLCLTLAALNTAAILPLYANSPTTTRSPDLSVVVMNVHEKEEAQAEMTQFIQSQNPDLLLILEADYAWVEAMSHLQDIYPYALLEPRYAGRGIALYSRLPWQTAVTWDVVQTDRPALVVTLLLSGQLVTIVGLHPYPPVNPREWRLHNQEMTEVATFVRQQSGPVIVMGDLNTTPWSSTFQDFLTDSGLRNGRIGFGLQSTWPVIGPTAWLPFDHVLTTPDLIVSQLATGNPVGSDHLPLIATLTLAP